MQQYEASLKYLPTKKFYEEVYVADDQGYYTRLDLAATADPTASKQMESMIMQVDEQEDLIKKSYLFSEEKKREFCKNNREQHTLREQVAELTETVNRLESEKKQAASDQANNERDQND
jgi:hypothetical protein